MDEITNLDYVKKKLRSFLKEFENEKTLTIKERQLKENLTKMITDIDNHILKDKNDLIYHYKSAFIKIINELNEEIEFNKNLPKPIKTDYKPYQERAYSKLNYLFRKNELLSDNEAQIVYMDYQLINEKYNIFLELINWLNDNGLAVIPEKTLFSAYLGISVECYNDLLINARNEQVRILFKNIDEYFTTNQFGALINNDRKALERIQKTKTYGQEMQQTQPDVLNVNQTNVLSYNDIMQNIKKKNMNIIDMKEE